MARETLKNFLNSIGKTADGISYKVNPSSGDPNDKDSLLERGLSDLGIDPNTDIPLIDFDQGKGLLGDYLSHIIENNNNEFKINPGNKKIEGHIRGSSLQNDHDANHFIVNNTNLSQELNKNSNSGKFENLSDIVDKTSKEKSNHNLLSDLKGGEKNIYGSTPYHNREEGNPVYLGVNNVLKANNRFLNLSANESNTYVPNNTNESTHEAGADQGSYTLQNKFGKFEKEDLKYSLDELKEVGLSLLYKATGYDKGGTPGESIDVSELENIDESQVPTNLLAGDKFQKIDFENLRAINAASAPKNETGYPYNSDNYFINTSGKSNKTFGSTYNPTANFSNKRLAKIKAIIASKYLIELVKDFYEDFKTSIAKSDEATTSFYSKVKTSRITKGPFYLGSSRGLLTANLDFIKTQIIVPTKYPYEDCIDAGIETLFGDKNEPDGKILNESPGYLISLCFSVGKSISSLIEDLSSNEDRTNEELITLIENIKGRSKIIKVFKVLATIGDNALKYSGGNKEELLNIDKSRNIDSFKDLPGHRVSKSRKRNGKNLKKLNWNQNDVPSSYLLPTNIIRASMKLDQGIGSPNPLKGMLGSELVDNTYISVNNDGKAGRIPKEVVKELEDRLDAEYVPFYIQDLRTNEIISFHAFLSSLSDTISANHSPTNGYGRLDPVQTYTGTTRQIGVNFTLVSTSKEDFNSMWYKINKLTTLMYPQWTQGTKVSSGDDRIFIQPHSQVIGASPIVRMRVGDVIKSNYSRFNFARTFGIGDPGIKAKPDLKDQSLLNQAINLIPGASDVIEAIQEGLLKTLILIFGSPMQLLNIGGVQGLLNNIPGTGGGFELGSAIQETLSMLLINGFVNPLTSAYIAEKLKSPNSVFQDINAVKLFGAGNASSLSNAILNEGFSLGGAAEDAIKDFTIKLFPATLKANTVTGYQTTEGREILLYRPVKINILETDAEANDTQIMYKVIINDVDSEFDKEELYCEFTDILMDPDFVFQTSGLGAFFGIVNGAQSLADTGVSLVQQNQARNGASPKLADMARNLYKKDEVIFMEPENNPYVKAYESTLGRGLAGVLDGITFNWLNENFLWETDHNARAPIGCKIGLNLKVIHDIPPGLDHTGYNRAPLYNVGDIMGAISGDPYEDNGTMSKFRYNTGRENKKTGE